MIERGLYYLPGPPPLVALDRARIDCGCMVLVGVRVDREPPEAATAALPCSTEHDEVMERFNLALTDTLVNPTGRPMIEVVEELLTAEAAHA